MHSYAQCGDLDSSVSVFEAALRYEVRFDVKQWSCLMSPYTEHGMHKETQATFERMTAAGVQPNEVTFTVLLSCAAHMNSLSVTQHPPILDLIAALMHSYAQCGDLESSVSVFEAALRDGARFDVKGWNCLLSAYTEHGLHKETQTTLERMTAAAVQPNEVTALCLLNAASHAGLGLGMRQLYDQLQNRFPDLKLSASHRTIWLTAFHVPGLTRLLLRHTRWRTMWRGCLS